MDSNTRLKGIFLLILIVLLIQSCGGSPSPVVMPVAQTAPKSATPAGTPLRISPAAATDTPTPDFVVTLHVIETAQVSAIISTVQPVILGQYPSSDGKWRVEVIRHECSSLPDFVDSIAYEQLKLINVDDGTAKIIDDQLQNCGGIGTYGLGGLYWSPSNRYFYYTNSREGYPGGCGNYVMPAIYRLDIASQESILLGGGHLSPDGTKLAMWQGDEIMIWDLDRGEIGRIQSLVPEFFPREIVWAPDSLSLVYLQTEFDCARDYGISYVIHVDIGRMSQTLLIKYPPPGFGEVDWRSPGQITLRDGDGKYWIYDLATKEKVFLGGTPFTPTSVPPGIFALKFYPPLIMSYVPSEWKDESRYTDLKLMVNYLQARKLTSCVIGVQGPTDFNGTPPAFVLVSLGSIRYSVIYWGADPQNNISAMYIEDGSLKDYDYVPGLPILGIHANAGEWDKCKALAEKVLSTLRVP